MTRDTFTYSEENGWSVQPSGFSTEVFTTLAQFGAIECRSAYRANLEGTDVFAFMQEYARRHRGPSILAGIISLDVDANDPALKYTIHHAKAVEVGERMVEAGRALCSQEDV